MLFGVVRISGNSTQSCVLSFAQKALQPVDERASAPASGSRCRPDRVASRSPQRLPRHRRGTTLSLECVRTSRFSRLFRNSKVMLRNLSAFSSRNRTAWERLEHGADDPVDWGALGFTIQTLYGVSRKLFPAGLEVL